MKIKKILLRWWYRRDRSLTNFFKEKQMSSVTISTKHAPWVLYRTILASDTILTDSTKKGANVPSHAYRIPDAMNNVEIRISATNEGDQGTAYFYGARRLGHKDAKTFDDISLIGSAAVTAGAQLATAGPNFGYVDTVVLVDKWITEVKVADGGAKDGMSRIAFDASGYDAFFLLMDFTDDTDWIVDISGW